MKYVSMNLFCCVLTLLLTLDHVLEEVKGQAAVELPPIEGEDQEVIVTANPAQYNGYTLAQAMARIDNLQLQVDITNQTLYQRILKAESDNLILTQRVITLEGQLNQKIQSLDTRLTREVIDLTNLINSKVNNNGNIDAQLSTLNYTLGNALLQRISAVEESLLQRIRNLETGYYNTLSEKVDNLGVELNGKINAQSSRITRDVTELNSNILSNVSAVNKRTDNQIATLRSNLEGQILLVRNDLGGQIESVRTEVIGLISNLENGKVQLLLNHNELWKKNFRVINATLVRIRKKIQVQGTGQQIVGAG